VTRRRGWPDHPAIGELADGVRTRLGVSPNHASFRVGALRTHLLTAVFAHAVAARLNTTAHVLLRCDDTDARRTDPAHLPRLIDELTTVAAIPLVPNDAHAVPRQRRRQSRYRAALAALRELGVTKSLGDVIHLDVAAADAVLRSRSDEQIATMRARVINGPGGQRSHPSALVPLTRADAPALWRLVDELAAAAATRPPDEIILIPQVNAAVSERTVLMGLISRRRYLYIGLPLLMTLTVAQVRAVLGHEFGHYSGRHTRLSAISYRGGLVIAQTVTSMSRRNVAGWMFRAYARLYWIAQSSVRRLQEREADLLAAQVGGREAARSALIEVEVIGQAFAFFLEQYVRLGMGSGLPSR